jgi:hypothetical protein
VSAGSNTCHCSTAAAGLSLVARCIGCQHDRTDWSSSWRRPKALGVYNNQVLPRILNAACGSKRRTRCDDGEGSSPAAREENGNRHSWAPRDASTEASFGLPPGHLILLPRRWAG